MARRVGYTYNVAGQRLTMSLPGGGTWSYTYSGPTLPKDDPNTAANGLATITDDQNRVVNYYLDTQAQPREVWSDQSFSGGNLASYLRCAYTMDTNGDGSRTHRWIAEVQNSWNVKNFMTQQWTAT